MKPQDDPRDVGVHDAELHGVAVDGATGEPVQLGPFDVFVWPRWDLPEGDLEHDLLANLIHAPMGPSRSGRRRARQIVSPVQVAAGQPDRGA